MTCFRCGTELRSGTLGEVFMCSNPDCGMLISREDYEFIATMMLQKCEHCHGTGYIAVERSLTAEPTREPTATR